MPGPGRTASGRSLVVFFVAALGLAAQGPTPATSAETWCGLVVTPEHPCLDYNLKRDYPYAESVERDIVRRQGAVYGPYTGHVSNRLA